MAPEAVSDAGQRAGRPIDGPRVPGVHLGRAPVEVEDAQGLMVRGYGRFEGAAYLVAQVVDAAAARTWLAELANPDDGPGGRIQVAGVDPQHDAVNVALSWPGLEALGLRKGWWWGWDRAFRAGMDSDRRARLLHDHGPSHRERWSWGRKDEPPHVLVLLFTEEEAAIEAAVERYRREAGDGGLEVIRVLRTRRLSRDGGLIEHFGFRDGIAQPALLRTDRDSPWREQPPGNWIEPGEIILGYDGEAGRRAPIPTPVEGPAPPGFALNGSYLVFRQLHQEVAHFWRWLRGGGRDVRERLLLAGKVVGRMPDGEPLAAFGCPEDVERWFRADETRRATPPGERPRRDPGNAFDYRSDPRGSRCPVSSHVRRCNPRDATLSERPADAAMLANQHRIVRRGRTYGSPLALPGEDMPEPAEVLSWTDDEFEAFVREAEAGGPVERGLHFVCLQSDIARQFEFVHNSWIRNRVFGGGDDEPDPLVGDGDGWIRIPGEPARRRVRLPRGDQRLVQVRGGGYFFVPGVRALRWLGGAPDRF